MEIEIEIINAFVDGETGGNPAGVLLNADTLTNDQKQEVARKAGFSETAFVSHSSIADFKLDFFTPLRQIAHCGHATIATFSYLNHLGRIGGSNSSKETLDGKREILIEEGLAFMEQSAPYYKPLNDLENDVLKSIGISHTDLIPGLSPMLVNTGNSFVIIPINSRTILKNLVLDSEAIKGISEKLGLIGFYVFTTETVERDATTRMFAPYYGINEESATGMAAGPLVCYLREIAGVTKDTFMIEQGHFMNPPSPSLIEVNLELEEGKIKRLFAGGKGLKTGTKKVILD